MCPESVPNCVTISIECLNLGKFPLPMLLIILNCPELEFRFVVTDITFANLRQHSLPLLLASVDLISSLCQATFMALLCGLELVQPRFNRPILEGDE